MSSIPGGNSGFEWNFELDRVRNIACCQIPLREWVDFFFDYKDVFCVNYDVFDILYIWNENVLLLINVEEHTIAVRALLISSIPSFISKVI